MSKSFFRLQKSWYDGELWIIPGDYQNMAFCDSQIFKICEDTNTVIAMVDNYSFYLHGQNPVFFEGFLKSYI